MLIKQIANEFRFFVVLVVAAAVAVFELAEINKQGLG